MSSAQYILNTIYVVWTLGNLAEIFMLWWYSIEYFVFHKGDAGPNIVAAFLSLVFTAFAFQIGHYIVFGS